MGKILLVTPPFLQPNSPYPATAYLKSYLARHGHRAEQYDLSVELLGDIFSKTFLERVFTAYAEHKSARGEEALGDAADANLERIYALRSQYTATIESVMAFLRGEEPTLATAVCRGDFLPQAGRFETMSPPEEEFGWMGIQDCAKYICTLYLQDISDFIRATVTPAFEIVRYAEHLSLSLAEFSTLEAELLRPMNIIEERMTELLFAAIAEHRPDFVAFTVPFPGNLLAALRCGQQIKLRYPDIRVIMGGGYPTTELRLMSDRSIFSYVDYIVLDDGETTLARILEEKEPTGAITAEGYHTGAEQISHRERGCPDFSGLPLSKYFSLCEVTNPMHRLWSDGRWNKMMLAHGCYWAKCAFCDTSLDYIGRYDAVTAAELADWMDTVAAQTGSRGFHFVDEAAPPRLLRDLSLELLRRGRRYTWWTNIRFERAFTGDLCRLMAAAGCIAVSGGLEVASDRLLEMIRKGITIEQATIAMRNFYEAGIMVHAYLMYGLPTQTLQETVDALEVVRQLFRAELVGSAFWHRYAMTVHSPSGQNPERFGVRRKGSVPNPFANNEVFFSDNRGYDIGMVGDALRLSLANYMAGNGLDRPVHKWFAAKVPHTTVEESLIAGHLIKPDASRIFDEQARLVWIGGSMERIEEGIRVRSNSEEKTLRFSSAEADFLLHVAGICGTAEPPVPLGRIKELYAEYSPEPFAILYHSKKWDILRSYGLLQV